jgi:hypothetical protein
MGYGLCDCTEQGNIFTINLWTNKAQGTTEDNFEYALKYKVRF